MEQIECDGFVIACSSNFYLVKCRSRPHAEIVQVARKLSPVELNFGDEVSVKVGSWNYNYKQAPAYVTKMNIRYKAISIQRIVRPEAINDEEASVAVRFPNKSFLLQYGTDAVYCPPSVCYPGMEEDDIVTVTAVSYPNAPANLSQNKCNLEVNYKCPNAKSLKFLRKPKTTHATGYLDVVYRQYGLVLGTSLKEGDELSIYLHANSVQPQPCTDLSQMFTERTPVKMFVIEQGANRRNAECAWRAVLATDDQHRITEEGGVQRITLPTPSVTRQENPPANSNLSTSSSSSSPSPSSKKIPDIRNSPSLPLLQEKKLPATEQQNASAQKKEILMPILDKKVAAIPFDPLASPLEEQNRKLRLLAHYLTDGPCKVCLTAENPLY